MSYDPELPVGAPRTGHPRPFGMPPQTSEDDVQDAPDQSVAKPTDWPLDHEQINSSSQDEPEELDDEPDDDSFDLAPVSSLFQPPWWKRMFRRDRLATALAADPEDLDVSSLGKRWRPPPKTDRRLQQFMLALALIRFSLSYVFFWKLRKEYRFYHNEIRDNIDHKRTLAVTVRKGGVGKTTTTGLLGIMYYKVTGRHTLAVDCNLESGHLAERMGVKADDEDAPGTRSKRGSMAYHELYDLVNLPRSETMGGAQGEARAKNRTAVMLSYADLMTMVCASDLNRVSVIASDTPKNVDDDFSLEGCTKVLATLVGTCHMMLVDTATSLSSFITRAAVTQADGLIIPSLLDEGFGLKDIKTTRTTFSKLKGEMPEKVNNAQIVLIGAKEKHLEPLAKFYGLDIAQMYIIDKNKYVHSKRPLDVRRLPLRLQVQLLHILHDAVVPELPTDNNSKRP